MTRPGKQADLTIPHGPLDMDSFARANPGAMHAQAARLAPHAAASAPAAAPTAAPAPAPAQGAAHPPNFDPQAFLASRTRMPGARIGEAVSGAIDNTLGRASRMIQAPAVGVGGGLAYGAGRLAGGGNRAIGPANQSWWGAFWDNMAGEGARTAGAAGNQLASLGGHQVDQEFARTAGGLRQDGYNVAAGRLEGLQSDYNAGAQMLTGGAMGRAAGALGRATGMVRAPVAPPAAASGVWEAAPATSRAAGVGAGAASTARAGAGVAAPAAESGVGAAEAGASATTPTVTATEAGAVPTAATTAAPTAVPASRLGTAAKYVGGALGFAGLTEGVGAGSDYLLGRNQTTGGGGGSLPRGGNWQDPKSWMNPWTMVGAPLGIYGLMQLLQGKGGDALLPLLLGGGLAAHGTGAFDIGSLLGGGQGAGAAPAAGSGAAAAKPTLEEAAGAHAGDPDLRQKVLGRYNWAPTGLGNWWIENEALSEAEKGLGSHEAAVAAWDNAQRTAQQRMRAMQAAQGTYAAEMAR